MAIKRIESFGLTGLECLAGFCYMGTILYIQK